MVHDVYVCGGDSGVHIDGSECWQQDSKACDRLDVLATTKLLFLFCVCVCVWGGAAHRNIPPLHLGPTSLWVGVVPLNKNKTLLRRLGGASLHREAVRGRMQPAAVLN